MERQLERKDAEAVFKSASLREKGEQVNKPFIIVRENVILLNTKAIFIYGQLQAWTLFSESLV